LLPFFGCDEDAGIALRFLCREDAIPEGESRGFLVSDSGQNAKQSAEQDSGKTGAGASVFIVKKQGQLFAYKNSCPHTGVNLDWLPDRFLNYEKDFIQCSLHGALFEIYTGYCVHGPCAKASLSAVVIAIQNGEVLVELTG